MTLIAVQLTVASKSAFTLICKSLWTAEHFKGNQSVFVLSEQFQFTFDLISYNFNEVDMYCVSWIYIYIFMCVYTVYVCMYNIFFLKGWRIEGLNTVFHHLETAEDAGDPWPLRKQVSITMSDWSLQTRSKVTSIVGYRGKLLMYSPVYIHDLMSL